MGGHRPPAATGFRILPAPVPWIVLATTLALSLTPERTAAEPREQLIPILGTTLESHPTGTVAYVIATFESRPDASGLAVQFKRSPGRFSRMAQTSIEQAIRRTARSLNLSTDSWTVVLAVPYPGLTIYGESLSAMVSLSIAAMATGRPLASGHVMTGTITPDGRIGTVGSVPLKVAAAGQAHLHRVLVPEEQDTADGDWQTPFLMQVSPVGSVPQAFDELTAISPTP